MANTKISALPSGNPAQSGDLIPIARSGANFSLTAQAIAALATSAPLILNSQVGTSYGIQNADEFALITFNNTAAVAVTLAQAGAGGNFGAGWWCYVENLNLGLVTITPTTSTISGWPQVVLAQNQWALIVSDGTNYDIFFTKISSPSAASALSAYVSNDAGTGVSQNQIVMQDLSVAGVNTLRKGLNIYFETAAQISGDSYDGLQVNVGATITANTSASTKHVEAAEFYAQASGSAVVLSQLNGVKVRTGVLASTSVSTVVGYLNYLPSIAGTVGVYNSFFLDSPAGGGTVSTFIGLNAYISTSGINVTNAFGGCFSGGGNGVNAALFLDSSSVSAGSIVWGAGPVSNVTPTITNGIYSGSGSPNGVVSAGIGSMYLNRSGGAATTLYVKESGAGTNTGWVGK